MKNLFIAAALAASTLAASEEIWSLERIKRVEFELFVHRHGTAKDETVIS